MDAAWFCNGSSTLSKASAAQGTTAAVLVPSGHKEAQQSQESGPERCRREEVRSSRQGICHLMPRNLGGDTPILVEVWPRRHPLTGSELLDEAPRKRGLITALVVLAVVALVTMSALLASASSRDPYVRSSLERVGDQEHGSKLFLINCAGCHGIAAQGVVGPNLHGR